MKTAYDILMRVVVAMSGETVRWPNIALGDRTRAIQRVGYLMPALTDDALHAVLLVAEAAPKRSLDRATLDEEQRAREGCRGCGVASGKLHEEGCARTMVDGAGDEVPHTCEAGTPSGLMLNLEVVDVDGLVLSTATNDPDHRKALHEALDACSGLGVTVSDTAAEQHDREAAALRSQVEALMVEVERLRAGGPADARERVSTVVGPGVRVEWSREVPGRLNVVLPEEAGDEALEAVSERIAGMRPPIAKVGICREGRSGLLGLDAQVERFKSGPARAAVDAAAERLGFVYLEPDGEGFKAREALFTALGALFGEAVKREPAIVAGARRAIEGRPVPGEVVDVEHSGERGLRHRDGCNGRRPKDGGSAWGTEPCDGCEVRS